MAELQKPICYLICVYNDQDGLNRSLASIYADDPLADILIIDDGSALPATITPPPAGFDIDLVTLSSNVGLIGALNKGLEIIMSKNYPYIARLDAGDTVNQGRLKAQYDYLEANEKIGLLGTNVRAFDPNTRKTLFHFNNPVRPRKLSRTLKMRNAIAHPSAMIRTQAFAICGGYDIDYKHGEDYEMWRRIEKYFGVANLKEVFVNKEITSTQITAVHRTQSIQKRLKAQVKYFRALNVWCYIGIIRSLISLAIPRSALNTAKNKAKQKA